MPERANVKIESQKTVKLESPTVFFAESAPACACFLFVDDGSDGNCAASRNSEFRFT